MTPAVLYVDDDLANLTVFEVAFGDDFPVLTAAGGAEALELLGKHEVGVLLVDQRMPGMTGVELLTRVRAEHPEPVRILMTAYSDLAEAIDAINQGHIRRYLRKPWNHDELRAALLEGLESYELRVRLAAMEHKMLESERVYALGVVAAGVAHELRNPMMVLMGHLELAREQARLLGLDLGVDPRRALALEERLEAIRRSVVRVREIMEGMSLAHRRRDDEVAADLSEVVRLTLTSLRGSLQRRARLVYDLPALPQVRGSSTRLGQVALNLLVNALQAIPEGADPSAHQVTVTVGAEEGAAVLRVADTGPGIPAELQARIFEPFFTTKRAGGTGLGLAITRQIVADLGGSIEVDSQEGQGTVFTVRLPWAPVPALDAR
ncbi:hybrid sensor histidine kinase/response regulator [Myxococcota bacterium]|nr:hybrid sensor histidine kinase/response regulator [Myxococcota bacterium]